LDARILAARAPGRIKEAKAIKPVCPGYGQSCQNEGASRELLHESMGNGPFGAGNNTLLHNIDQYVSFEAACAWRLSA
jgi:hypothetical protein